MIARRVNQASSLTFFLCLKAHLVLMQVNQRYWLQLRRPIELQGRQYTFEVCLMPHTLPDEESIQHMGVLEYLINAALRSQGNCTGAPAQTSRWPGVLFTSQLTPDILQTLPGFVYIHHQASMLMGTCFAVPVVSVQYS